MVSEAFKRIQRRLFFDAVVKSILLGLSAGALVAGGILLAAKLLEQTVDLPVTIVSGVVVFAVVALLALALLCKKERAIARELDETYGLREKVSTMVAFREESSEMVVLQREQTEQILQQLPLERSVIKRFGISTLALLLACAMLVSGIVIPAKTTPVQKVPEPAFELSQWQLGALELLIEEVKIAQADQSVKDEMVTELERLLQILRQTTTQRKMIDEVISTVVNVDLIVENANSFKKLCVALDAGKNGHVKKVAAAILPLNGIGFGERMAELRQEFATDKFREPLKAFATEGVTLLAETGVDAGDKLLTTLSAFFAELSQVCQEEETNLNTLQALLDKAFSNASDTVGTAISDQYANKTLRDRCIRKLLEIFQIPESALPPLLGDILPQLSEQTEQGSGDNENENTGGFGSGDNLFGSNDIIYHPFGEGGGAYIEYGEALSEYYKKVEELLLDGNLSEETKKIIIEYFARLSNGTKTE